MNRVLSCVVLSVLLAGPASAGPIFTTLLSPGNELPPVTSLAGGLATLEFSDGLDSIDFRLVLRTITSPLLQAHIHFGTPDRNGPVAIFLFDLCPLTGCGPGDLQLSGDDLVLAGTATAADLAPGASFESILDAIRCGAAYVNVHTTSFPGGELRGNLVPEPTTLVLLGAGLLGLAAVGRARRGPPL